MRFPPALVILLLVAAACGTGKTPSTDPTAEPPSAEKAVSASGVEEFSGESTGSGRCGDFTLEWRSPNLGGGGEAASLTVSDGSTSILDIKGRDEFEQLTPLWCGDITGDGRAELAHEAFTGGAHCCFRVRIDTLRGPTLLERDLGNAGGPKPEQLDAKGALEIVTFSDVLAYFDVSFAASPFLPLVFTYEDGRFAEATAKFPGHVRKSLKEAFVRLDNALEEADEYPEAAQGAALGVFGHYVLLGEESEGLMEIATRTPDELTQWVRERADRASEAIRTGKPPTQ